MSSKGNDTKPRIGIFGRRNRGKSTLLNLLTGQQTAIVSSTPGTTTDPVRKTFELAGVGPVVWVDTAGIDDDSTLGRQRIEKTMLELAEVSLALILFSNQQFGLIEVNLVEQCIRSNIPYIIIYSLSDVFPPSEDLLSGISRRYGHEVIPFNQTDAHSLSLLVEQIGLSLPESAYRVPNTLEGIVGAGETVVLVCPIDESAPEGRLILPQVQTLRNLLDLNANALVCQPAQLSSTLQSLSVPPSLVVTDSQAFSQVSQIVPEFIPLTSFSILLARAKGPFSHYLDGLRAIDSLRDGDRVAMLESCSHTVTCSDIGRVKLPRLLSARTGRQLQFEAVSKLSSLLFPVSEYALIIQCGGCVISPQQLNARLSPAISAQVPVTNYGLALAHLAGILPRAIKPFLQKNNPNPQE